MHARITAEAQRRYGQILDDLAAGAPAPAIQDVRREVRADPTFDRGRALEDSKLLAIWREIRDWHYLRLRVATAIARFPEDSTRDLETDLERAFRRPIDDALWDEVDRMEKFTRTHPDWP